MLTISPSSPASIRARTSRTIGIDRITFETDYPHSDSTWPDSRAVAAKLLAGLDADSVNKILRANAIELFHLDLR